MPYARFVDDFRSAELFGSFGQDVLLGDPPPAASFAEFLEQTSLVWNGLQKPDGREWNGHAFAAITPRTQHSDIAATYGETLELHGPRALEFQRLVPTGPIRPPFAAPSYDVCTTWKEVFIDSNTAVFGNTEDFFLNFTLGDAPARFTSAVITDATKAVVWAGFLDLFGCTGPIQLPDGAYWLWQDSKLDDGKRSFEIVSGAPYVPPMGSAQPTQIWFGVEVSAFTVSGSGGVVQLSPNGHGSTTRIAAAMGQVLFTPDNGLRTDHFAYQVQSEQGCFSSQNAYCTLPEENTQECYQACFDNRVAGGILRVGGNVGDAPPDSAYKYIIGHELGHYVQWASFGDQFWTWGTDSMGNIVPQIGVTTPVCRCDHIDVANRLHCLQSDEEQGFGSHEGFAHFYASRVWNAITSTSGVFAYYKHFLQPLPNQTTTNVAPPIGRSASGTIKWLDTECLTEPKPGRSVEWDWLTFYYDINVGTAGDRTPLGGVAPNLGSIYERACGTPGTACKSQIVRFSNLVSAASIEFGPNDPRFLRFNATGNTHGINH